MNRNTAIAAAVVALAAAAATVYLVQRAPFAPEPLAAVRPQTPPQAPAAAVPPPPQAVPGAAVVTAANKREYFLQCRPCHSVTQPDGTVTMLGSGLGSDLYGIIDRPAAMQQGFAYSDSMRQAAALGLVWTVENILEYAKNPKRFLRDFTGDPKAEGTMVYALVKGQDDLIDYLRAAGPQQP